MDTRKHARAHTHTSPNNIPSTTTLGRCAFKSVPGYMGLKWSSLMKSLLLELRNSLDEVEQKTLFGGRSEMVTPPAYWILQIVSRIFTNINSLHQFPSVTSGSTRTIQNKQRDMQRVWHEMRRLREQAKQIFSNSFLSVIMAFFVPSNGGHSLQVWSSLDGSMPAWVLILTM